MALLALSFAFGLAVLGGALATSVQSYLRAAAREQRQVLDRISLESAATEALGRFSAGEARSLGSTRLPDVTLNGRPITLVISLPEGKRDPAMDGAATIRDALKTVGVADASAPLPPPGGSLAALRLPAAREDCLRRVLTYGRAPEGFRDETAPSGAPVSQAAVQTFIAGDQVDLRASLPTAEGGERVLWLRARFGAQASPAWALHDYRNLLVPRPICGALNR